MQMVAVYKTESKDFRTAFLIDNLFSYLVPVILERSEESKGGEHTHFDTLRQAQ